MTRRGLFALIAAASVGKANQKPTGTPVPINPSENTTADGFRWLRLEPGDEVTVNYCSGLNSEPFMQTCIVESTENYKPHGGIRVFAW